MRWKHVFLGAPDFAEGSDYLQFRYAFLMVAMLSGVPFASIFIVADRLGANSIGRHVHSVQAYVFLTCVLIALLRGRPRFYVPVAWAYAVATFCVHISGFMLVPADELRLDWFYALIAGSYIVLGQRGGAFFVVASMAAVLVGNPLQATPISSRGIGTFLASLGSLAVLSHFFSGRAEGFYRRMAESNRQLRHLARHDALTGVLNLRAFSEVAGQMILHANRRKAPYAVLFVDLDHFKRINDEHGHEAGDTVLRAVASCMTARVRKSDIVGRIGGEEFLIFLPDTDGEGARQLGEVLRDAIERLAPDVGGRRLTVTASIGVAVSRADRHSLVDLQREADQAMYRAKAAGRNRVTVWA